MTGARDGDVRLRPIDTDNAAGRGRGSDGRGQRTGPRPDIEHVVAIDHAGELHQTRSETAAPSAHEDVVGLSERKHSVMVTKTADLGPLLATESLPRLRPWSYHFGMAYRFFSVAAVAIAVAAFAGVQPAGQAPPSAKPASKSTFTPTRTPDGQPDLQGYWTNASFTPLERPAGIEKEFFTPAEAAAYEKQRIDAFLGQPADNVHYDDAIWQTETYKKGVSGLRTSLIVDPREGRIPPLTPEGRKRAADRAARRGNPYDAAQNASNLERCLTWGADVPPLLPAVYYSNLQIMQGAGYVVVMTETIH